MLFKLILLNCFLIYVICDDLISIPDLPKISIGEDKKDDSSSKSLKLSGQKHVISGGGAADLEKKIGNAEKISNYEKDKGFFFMKAYGWDREKKNEHLNAEGKHLKASKTGKIFKAGGEFNNDNSGQDKNYFNKNNYDQSYDNGNQFSKRAGYTNDEYSKPYEMPAVHNEEFKYLQPQVEYTENEPPSSYELIHSYEPKTNYYPNKEYTRIHYPKISGSYLPEMNYYKNSKKYPTKNFLWNQGYHAAKYYKPQKDDHQEDNMIEYYGNEKKYNPNELNNYSNDHHHYYGNDEDEGRHYYDKKITDYDIDKLRASYSKYNDDYAGSQLVHIESPPPPTVEPAKKQYRLWQGSHYY